MKRYSRQMNTGLQLRQMAGVALLEVVLAIAVFAFGMLALVQLQGNLTRSSSDANTRTVAGNIAEELLEDLRGYERVQAIEGNDAWEYLELFGTAFDQTVNRGGLDYAVTAEISDFWWDQANDRFIETEATDPPSVPAGLPQAYADFKLMQLNVAWDTPEEFYVDDETTADLGSGSITVYEIIPSSPPSLGAKIAADLNAPAVGPIVEYSPGEKPDIIALTVGDDRLKESTTPVPDIIRTGDLTETYFDVISYNQASAFLRREEFVTVGCECELDTNSGADEFGFRPTVWNGVEYTEGDRVYDKNIGRSANNQQSVFCDVCCRDHHDGGTGENDASYEYQREVYDPWHPPAEGNDHEHYTRTKKGDVVVAGDGDVYLEACRLIRRDGFFRVAQDFNQRAFFALADDYLDNLAEIAEYSDYVTTAVDEFYSANPAQDHFPLPGDPVFVAPDIPLFTNPADGGKYPYLPASREDVLEGGPYTSLPTALGFETQQLRSRGIYLDYMTDELKAKIAACEGGGGPCPIPGFTGALEVYPFFEVQLTNLSNWDESPPNKPVDVTNEVISSTPYSRGRADLKARGMGKTKADFGIHKGNVGMAATDPIRPNDPKAADTGVDFIHIDTIDGDEAPVVGFEIIGEIRSGVGGVRAVDVQISFNEAECGRTPTGYRCIVPELAANPTLTVSNYFKANKNLYACSPAAEGGLGDGVSVLGADPSTRFSLPSQKMVAAHIVIQDTPCLAGGG